MRKLMILLAAASICSAAYAGPVMDNDIAKAPKKVEERNSHRNGAQQPAPGPAEA